MHSEPSAKARKYLEALNALPIQDRPEYARVIPNLSAFEDELLELGCPLDDIDALMTELQFYRGESPSDSSMKLAAFLRAALERPAETSTVEALAGAEPTYKPKFPTGIWPVDFLTGGGYGVTTIGGDAKAGKTTAAICAAVAACRAGWRVVYVNAELDRNEAILAFMRACGGEIPGVVIENLTLVTPDFAFTPLDCVNRASAVLEFGDARMLLVLDSINALVDLTSDAMGGGGDYWAANAVWRNFAVRATKLSLGKIAFLCISETNKDGGIKGRTLEYKSDLVVRITKDPSDFELVDITVTHSRSTRSGECGSFRRDWENGRFTLVG